MNITLLNSSFEKIAIIDDFKSLIWTDRYNSYGDFELYISMGSAFIPYIHENYYLSINDSDRLMIIENIEIKSDVEESDHMIITGRSLESILNRRIIFGSKMLLGNLQTEIQSLLTDNIINPSIVERKINNFIFEASADTAITDLTIDAQYEFENLYSIIENICYINNIGFKIVLNDSNQLVFSLYAGKNRAYSQDTNSYVIFSPNFENLISSNYYNATDNSKNVTLVVGNITTGTETEVVSIVVGETSGLERREIFTDARNTSNTTDDGTLTNEEYMNLLVDQGIETLYNNYSTYAFEGEISDISMFKYNSDFFIGDVVQLEDAYGHDSEVYISEIIISNNEEGYSIHPTFQTL